VLSAKTALVIAVIAITASTAAAQGRPSPFNGEAIIYRGRDYSGPAVSVDAEQENLGLSWSVNSLHLISGRMQLCSAPHFRGTCRIVAQSYPDLTPLGLPGNRVESMRPVAAVATFAAPGLSVHGPTLEGTAAQFYATPMEDGLRVQACPRATASVECARRHAQVFCERRGYDHASYQSMEGVGDVSYLTDVLCSRRT
jgi:hypothetical protein